MLEGSFDSYKNLALNLAKDKSALTRVNEKLINFLNWLIHFSRQLIIKIYPRLQKISVLKPGEISVADNVIFLLFI